jgi:hypothetical protein
MQLVSIKAIVAMLWVSTVSIVGIAGSLNFPSWAVLAAVAVILQRSPKLTQACSPEVDHSDFPPLTRASADAREAALLHLSPMVCAGPPRGSSPARVFGDGLSDRSPRTDASLLASP